MKKIIVIILLMLVLILPNSVYAEQSEKRIDLELGLSAITSDRLDGYDTGINFGLSLELKQNDNIYWMVSAYNDRFEIEDNISWEIKLNSFGLMGGAKYYTNNNDKQVRTYIGISTGLLFADEEIKSKNDIYGKNSDEIYFIGLKPNLGINFPVTDKFDFYLDLSYQFNIEIGSDKISDNLFSDYKFFKTCFGFSIDI